MNAENKMTMVERVARAIDPVGWAWHDRAEDGRAPDDPHPAKPSFVGQAMRNAEAAVAAMRDPTEAMWLAPAMADACVNGILPSGDEAEAIWRAMIDAALSEPKP